MSFPDARTVALAALIFLLGLALRLPALGTAFWFDEVWSWQLAHSVAYPWEILTQVRHDNNHPLNTLILSLEPAGLPWAWYRVHSLAVGVLTLPLAMGAVWHRGRTTALVAGLLFAVNFWMVMVSTEARGYALVIFFALLGYLSLRCYLAREQAGWLVVFWLAVVLGFLSHLTFLHAEAGFVAWSLRHYARRSKRPGDEIVPLLRCHLVPGVFVVAYGIVNVLGMDTGGGETAPLLALLGRLFQFGLGLPLPLVALGVAAAVGARGLVLLEEEERVFFATTVVVFPGLILLTRPAYLFERYFFVSFAFFLLLLADVLADRLRRTGLCRVVGALALVAICVGSLREVGGFLRDGRGEPLAAIRYVADHGGGAVTGDTDFRVEKMVTFYRAYLPDPGAVHYVRSDERADWLLVHWRDGPMPPDDVEIVGRPYQRVPEAVFPPRGPGYWGWLVYRPR